MDRRVWSDEEMILSLDLYYKLPFGRLNQHTPEVRELASLIGRTPSSVALRLVNYAACDPYIVNSGRRGMVSGIGKCKPFWDHYADNTEELFLQAENIEPHYWQSLLRRFYNLIPRILSVKRRRLSLSKELIRMLSGR